MSEATIIPTLHPDSLAEIWKELTLTYGHAFLARWDGLELQDVKDHWAKELAILEGRPECIQYALEHKPKHPPTAPEFRALALSRPHDPQLYLPGTDEKRGAIPPHLVPIVQRALAPREDSRPKAVIWAQAYVDLWDGKEKIGYTRSKDLQRAKTILADYKARQEHEARRKAAIAAQVAGGTPA